MTRYGMIDQLNSPVRVNDNEGSVGRPEQQFISRDAVNVRAHQVITWFEARLALRVR